MAVVFPLAGYLTVGHVKTCRAQICGTCGNICIAPNSLSDALNAIYNDTIQPALDTAQQELVAYMGPMVSIFNDAIFPVLDWTKRQFDALIDTLWYYNLLPSMQDMARQLNTADAEQSFARGAFEDAANINRAAATVADMQIADHRALRPAAAICMAGTMMSGMTRATSFSDGYNAAADVGKIWRSANDYDMPAHGGMALDMQYVWQHQDPVNNQAAGYVPYWCNTADNAGNAGCTQNGAYVDQDVDVAGTVFGEDTIPLTTGFPKPLPSACVTNPEAVDALSCNSPASVNLDRLVVNLAEPFVKDPVTANPDKGGKAAILASVSYKAKRQVVYDGLNYVISRRVPAGLNYADESASNKYTNNQLSLNLADPPTQYQPGFQPLLKQIRALTGEDVTTADNPSRDEILRALMTQRFRSGMYAVGQINEPENSQREMVVDDALQVIQMSDDLDIMDHEMLLLASQVSNEVESQYDFGNASEGTPMK
ncbi:MAG: hypothetical protein KGL10_01675 [Alphaproteobacteria bacterium]|nr:hypothetical protein [Alphaproteobacteria bacterium]